MSGVLWSQFSLWLRANKVLIVPFPRPPLKLLHLCFIAAGPSSSAAAAGKREAGVMEVVNAVAVAAAAAVPVADDPFVF